MSAELKDIFTTFEELTDPWNARSLPVRDGRRGDLCDNRWRI